MGLIMAFTPTSLIIFTLLLPKPCFLCLRSKQKSPVAAGRGRFVASLQAEKPHFETQLLPHSGASPLHVTHNSNSLWWLVDPHLPRWAAELGWPMPAAWWKRGEFSAGGGLWGWGRVGRGADLFLCSQMDAVSFGRASMLSLNLITVCLANRTRAWFELEISLTFIKRKTSPWGIQDPECCERATDDSCSDISWLTS